jgi:hypothetical protein
MVAGVHPLPVQRPTAYDVSLSESVQLNATLVLE